MKPVYQRIVDSKIGDCFKCCICSLLELDYDSVPNFIELEGENAWYLAAQELFKKHGYKFHADTLYNPNLVYLENPTEYCFEQRYIEERFFLGNLKEEDGIDGYFLASVYSPKYTSASEHPINHLHQVLCNKNFEIVFDPCPEYKGILEYPYAHLIKYNGIRAIDTIKKL